MPITLIRIGLEHSSLVPRPSQPPGFDCLQHANTEGEGFCMHLAPGIWCKDRRSALEIRQGLECGDVRTHVHAASAINNYYRVCTASTMIAYGEDHYAVRVEYYTPWCFLLPASCCFVHLRTPFLYTFHLKIVLISTFGSIKETTIKYTIYGGFLFHSYTR